MAAPSSSFDVTMLWPKTEILLLPNLVRNMDFVNKLAIFVDSHLRIS